MGHLYIATIILVGTVAGAILVLRILRELFRGDPK
jgi:hypothetical protein